MAKGIFGGAADYTHQSYQDVLADLAEEAVRAAEFIKGIEEIIDELQSTGYWENTVPAEFRGILAYSLKHYRTAKEEIETILKEIEISVQGHHIVRLQRIAAVANEINGRIGKVWHTEGRFKEYDNSEFRKAEEIYMGTREEAVNLLDVSNMAERLEDFVGKGSGVVQSNNPWRSGSFYILLVVVVFGLVAVMSYFLSWLVLPIALIAAILVFGVVGAMQLRNDDRLSEKGFLSLIFETYRRLPLLKAGSSRERGEDS